MEYQDRLDKIISIIRKHPEWEAEHKVIKFGGKEIEYYDEKKQDKYFTIKHAGVEVNRRQDESVTMEFSSWPVYEIFHLRNWLDEVEDIVKEEVELPKEKVELPEEINANPTYEDVAFYINQIIRYLKGKDEK